MIALADAGFHAIAPDFRGYGLSDQPPEIEKAGFVDLVEDLIGLLDAFSIQKVSTHNSVSCILYAFRIWVSNSQLKCLFFEFYMYFAFGSSNLQLKCLFLEIYLHFAFGFPNSQLKCPFTEFICILHLGFQIYTLNARFLNFYMHFLFGSPN